MKHLLLLASLLALAACDDDKDDTGTAGDGGAESDGGTDDGGATDGGTDDGDAGFTVSGTALNLADGSAAAEGLCVYAADPTAAISGGELDLLAEGTIGTDGAYSVAGIETTSTVGLLMLVQDCDDAATVMPTATGISADSYSGLGDGDELSDVTIYSVDATTQAGFSKGLAAAGYTGDLATDGALIGFVVDASGSPVADAVVTGPDGYTTYYLNADGSFNTEGTVAEAGALFIVPAGPIYNYSCEADGYTFGDLLVGSQPGYAVLIRFDAE